MKSVEEASGLANKKVFVRVDFNIPSGTAAKSFRIKAHKQTIDFLVSQGAKIALVSHTQNSDGFRSILEGIKQNLGYEIAFEQDILKPRLENQITLFENIRKYKGEEKNDENFARELAKNFNLYVNEAFSESHRPYASISGVPKFISSYAGFNLIKETENLSKVISAPAQGKILIMGGAKVETKAPVIKNFLDKAERILLGGAVANLFLKRSGIEIGRSVSGELELIKDIDSGKIVLPCDYYIGRDVSEDKSELMRAGSVPADFMILDIGPETIDIFREMSGNAKIFIWNGPIGYTENKNYENGSKEIGRLVSSSKAFSVVGGGDTLAFLEKENMIDKFSYVSTGGGAMLEFLASKRLPGLEALKYYGN